MLLAITCAPEQSAKAAFIKVKIYRPTRFLPAPRRKLFSENRHRQDFREETEATTRQRGATKPGELVTNWVHKPDTFKKQYAVLLINLQQVQALNTHPRESQHPPYTLEGTHFDVPNRNPQLELTR